MAFIKKNFIIENFWKSWKNWNYLHKILVTMYSICYTRAAEVLLFNLSNVFSLYIQKVHFTYIWGRRNRKTWANPWGYHNLKTTGTTGKGQLISKCLFGGFNFFQKMNKNTSHSSKNEFIRSFFGRIHGLTVFFRN